MTTNLGRLEVEELRVGGVELRLPQGVYGALPAGAKLAEVVAAVNRLVVALERAGIVVEIGREPEGRGWDE